MPSPDPETELESPAAFPSTRWTEILEAGSDGTALENFCRRYWQPVYRQFRARGANTEDARDLAQKFFHSLIEKKTLAQISREGGRFRSFLLTALRHFAINEWERGQALKRGGGQRAVELDALETWQQPAAEDAADFDRDWGLALLDRALDRLAEEHRREKKLAMFETLRPFLTGAADGAPYGQVAAQLGTTEANVKVLVHRLRKRFGALLREEVLPTVDRAEEVSGEIRHLAQVVTRARPEIL